jgi:hypothetical protein
VKKIRGKADKAAAIGEYFYLKAETLDIYLLSFFTYISVCPKAAVSTRPGETPGRKGFQREFPFPSPSVKTPPTFQNPTGAYQEATAARQSRRPPRQDVPRQR